jgi:hypothetical protein
LLEFASLAVTNSRAGFRLQVDAQCRAHDKDRPHRGGLSEIRCLSVQAAAIAGEPIFLPRRAKRPRPSKPAISSFHELRYRPADLPRERASTAKSMPAGRTKKRKTASRRSLRNQIGRLFGSGRYSTSAFPLSTPRGQSNHPKSTSEQRQRAGQRRGQWRS